MGIDRAHYHGWDGKLGSPLGGCLALVRVALIQVFRRKSYWIVLGLGLMHFLFFLGLIYSITQLELPADVKQGILRGYGFSAEDDAENARGYTGFMDGQSVLVSILLAFAGSTLVGADFRQKSLPFYLSRRIDRRHYILGKLLAVGALISLLTTIPALVLFIEFSLFKSSTAYFLDHWRTPVAILAYGLTLSVTLGILLVTVSAYLQRLAPIAITWLSVFILLGKFGSFLAAENDDQRWRLLGPWYDIREVGRLCFPSLMSPEDRELALWALAILTVVCSLCLVALARRVRAVDIIQ